MTLPACRSHLVEQTQGRVVGHQPKIAIMLFVTSQRAQCTLLENIV